MTSIVEFLADLVNLPFGLSFLAKDVVGDKSLPLCHEITPHQQAVLAAIKLHLRRYEHGKTISISAWGADRLAYQEACSVKIRRNI